MLPEKQPSFLEESLKLLASCPICKAEYSPIKANVLEEQENAHLIHIQCDKCASAVVVKVTTNSTGATSVGLVTDLTPEDVLRFKTGESVSADDVLELHDLLNKGEFINSFN